MSLSRKTITISNVGTSYTEIPITILPDKFVITRIEGVKLSGTGSTIGVRIAEKLSPDIGEILKETALRSSIDIYTNILAHADKNRESNLGSIYIAIKADSGTNNRIQVTMTYASISDTLSSVYTVFDEDVDGLVPGPDVVTGVKYLRDDGVWFTPPGGAGSLPTTTLGDTIYHNGSTDVRLPGNTTTTKQFLTQTGNGSISAAPSWATIVAGDLPNNGVTNTKLRDSVGLSVIGRSVNSTGDPDDISATLPNQVLRISPDGTALEFSVLTEENITDHLLDYIKLQNTSTDGILLGRGLGSGGGTIEEITLGNGLVISGTVISNSLVDGEFLLLNTHPDLPNALTFNAGALLQTSIGGTYQLDVGFTTNEVIAGRNTAGAGVGEELQTKDILEWMGGIQGQILYRNATEWVVLNPGTAGYLLTTGGAGANPAWSPASPGGNHASSHQNGGVDELSVTGLSGLLADAQKIKVSDTGSLIGTRNNINLIEGSNITLTITDNSIDDRVDITIASSGGGGGGGTGNSYFPGGWG